MSETVRNDDGGIAVTVGLGLIQTCMFVYDFFTYPLYYAIQQPWKAVEAMNSVRAKPIDETKTSVTYKPVEKSCPDLERFKAAGIQTMFECFEYAVKLHSHARMVGTRKVIREEDEVQPNGKVFKKWEMGDYEWKSYTQVSFKTFKTFVNFSINLNPEIFLCMNPQFLKFLNDLVSFIFRFQIIFV